MIEEFQGEYRWLSNFCPCDINLEGVKYPSVEHAYMSAKSNDIVWKEFCSTTPSPGKVKRESRKIDLIDNWNVKKVDIMKNLIDKKFDKDPFKSLLLDTNDVYIQEGNRWGDVFWGVNLDTGKGRNILGKLIMDKRRFLMLKTKSLLDIIKNNS